ncbi:FimV/HubP family polar landmark protein [Iodobacter sp. CM08]|uniref:FimV/HubP family polar landmark protein n=1 Tax=Iodobacter sp. CM08 TaxID=3085902 RepID=UPI002980D870|nr:FimV/HubP family polar landmark protein [Iodobacter sp. CM08]MDW5415841.1 FimV/HubP family polar landmark protein [Iodobacter sp. CM08]
MPIKPKLKACVLAIMLAVPLSAGAVGLGRLNVLSGLGQPFRAEIDLVSVQPGEAEGLVARLAAPEAFAQAQVPYPSASMGLRFAVDKRANGQHYVLVSSTQSISEPFLDLVIDLKWADGKIQREYTALIDPLGYTPSATAGNSSRESFSPSVLPGTRRTGAIKSAARKSEAKSADVAAAADKSTDQQYKVKAGDTLSAVARQTQAEGISLEQMLVGLYRQNPDAFDGNMNRLRRGRILNVPGKEALQVTPAKEAAQEVRLQSKDWQAYRNKVAEAVQKRQAVAGNEPVNAGKITPKVEEKALPGSANQDVLKLSKGESPGKAKGDATAQGRIRALEEEVTARQKGLDESNQRVSELQKNIHDMEKLLALKSRTGAELQGVNKPNPVVASEASPQPVATPLPTPVATTVPLVASDVPAIVPDTASAASSVSPPKKIRRPVPAPEPIAEPGIVDAVMDNLLPLGGGLAAILLGGAGFAWTRRRKQGSAFADSVLTGGDLKSNTLLGNTGGAVISTQPTENSFLTDFSRQGLGTIDTDEVDPIAEAEVYMAYDRNEQAEEILRDALVKDPNRHEIRLKLLEILAAKKDKTSFEELAADLFTMTSGKGAHWEQAAYQGREIDPDNPLYTQAPVNTAFASTTAASVFDNMSMPADEFDLPLDELPEPPPASSVSDFDAMMGVEAAAAPSVDHQASLNDLDLSLDFDPSELDVVPPAAEHVVSPKSNAIAEFDLSLPELQPNVAAAAPVNPVLDDLASLDFGLDNFLAPEKAAKPVDAPSDNVMLDLDLPVDFAAMTAKAPAEVLAPAEPIADDPFDLNFDLDAMPEAAVDITASLPDLDLDESPAMGELPAFDGLLDTAPTPSNDGAEEVLEAISADDGLGLDFDFSLDTPLEITAPNLPAEESIDLGDLGLDFDSASAFSPAESNLEFAGDDPVQTKIDLAKAYVDMGDVEGAREILQEAIGEGNPDQQKQAQALLGNL